MSNKSLSGLFDREQALTGADLMLISQFTAAGWKSAQVTLEDFFSEMFQPTSSAGQLVAGIRTDLDDLENRFNMHENPSLNTANPNYDPHGGFFLQNVTLRSTNSGLEGNGRTENPLGIDYDYLNTIYARYSQVVNNLTSTSATLPLSANQGRVLDTTKSDISEVRKNFGSNFVGVVATTGYNLNNAAVGDYVYIDKGVATVTNAPPFQYSTTFTECSHLTTASRFQVARDYITGQFAVRGLQNGTWSAWRKQLLEGDSTSSVGSADKLTTARRINNVLFDGSQDITVYAEKPFNGTIANSTAENAATTPGYYTYTDTNTVTGLGAAGIDGWLEVIKVGDTIIQIRQTVGDVDYASDAMPAKTARRVKVAAGAWSSWMPMGPRTTAATTAEYGVTRLVNTLTSTADNNALTAAMGKQLQDTKANLASLRSEFGNRPIDLIVPNTYNWNNIVPGDFVFLNVAGTTNPPPFATCSVYCEKSYQGSGERFVMAREYATGRLAVRARQNNVWGGWITLLSSTDLANGITNHKAESDPHPQYLTQADVDGLASGGLVEHVLDLSGASFNVNTYYPVTISIAGQGRCNFEIDTPLGYAPAPWSTHAGGTISVVGKWSEYGSGWGGNSIQRTIDAFAWQFCVNSPIIDIDQMTQSSNVVFYARGKTKYRIKMTKGLVPVIRTSAYTANSQTVSPKTFDNTAPVSIQDRKLDASHLNEANPHPQYALGTQLTNYYPKTGGEISGNVTITGTTSTQSINSAGAIIASDLVRGRSLGMLNTLTAVNLTVSSYAADIIYYRAENTSNPSTEVVHRFGGGPVFSDYGFNLFAQYSNDGGGNIVNTSGSVIGSYTFSYVVLNQWVQSPGINQGRERYCMIEYSVDYPNHPGESTCKIVFPMSFRRPPTITTARKTRPSDSATDLERADADALIQFVNQNYVYVNLQYFGGGDSNDVRGFTLHIQGWV